MQATIFKLAVVGLGLSLGGLGCGSSSGSAGSCGQVEPCGGDVVGNWKFTGSCVNRMTVMDAVASDFSFCPTFTIGAVNLSTTGTATFGADMSYSVNATQSGSESFNLPASCLSGVSCAALSTAIQAAVGPGTGVDSASCTGSGGCTCTMVLTPTATSETGTYATSGNTLTTTASDGTVSGQDYCVKGTSMHLVEVDTTMNMGPMGQATINSDIVLQKQ